MAEYEAVLRETLAEGSARLAAYGYLLTGSQDAGEELVQEAVVKVFARRRAIPNARAGEAYVRATMRTLHVDGIRRAIRWRRIMPSQVAPLAADDSAATIDAADAMGQALTTLTPQQRTAIVLRYYEDLSLAAVAAAMGLAVGTVKRYLSDALGRLATAVGDQDLEFERIAVTERGE
ncbi:sigma-70 family RNA polymerase sigma factor [Demequina lutea]|uniref:RNA polymerase sigma factor (Sigma-70 family) n=1 Tax=Demequina lutea TaxID=431489 RepID=A0A7Y9Z7Q2_9MICO|nr:sigma-70 family RNA polymerase sigma factor [Demequina lutea]NYI40294.1 RNA polymerase sigma factor (sigma-70 family) [Demequina lutea]